MTKCNVSLPGEEVKDLILDVDLRINAALRINKVANVLLPLNDRLGEFHLSVNLFFKVGEAVRHINLPAYMTENEQERILHVLFPAEVQVMVYKDEAETSINLLEYHIDKRSEVVTEVSGTDPYEQNCGHNVLTLDVAGIDFNSDWTRNEELLASVLEQAKKVSDWDKPLDVIIAEGGMKNYCWTLNIANYSTIIQILARSYGSYIRPYTKEILEIVIKPFGEDAFVNIKNTTEVRRDLIFLYEDNNDVISGADSDRNNARAKPNNWNIFVTELVQGNQPAVFLASPTSGKYCPVAYTFELDETTKQVKNLVMDISYYKEVNGQFQLWIERRSFPGGCGAGASYYHGDDGMPIFFKFSLTPVGA